MLNTGTNLVSNVGNAAGNVANAASNTLSGLTNLLDPSMLIIIGAIVLLVILLKWY